MTESRNVALIFGASGISGWAVTKWALEYPSTTTFSRVIGLTNKPLPLKDSGLPKDSRLELYNGLNLRGCFNEVLGQLQEKVPNLEDITHVYYLGKRKEQKQLVTSHNYTNYISLLQCNCILPGCHGNPGYQCQNDL
jgi:hypothetical protein